MEEDVWHNFTNDPKKLSETAKAIHLIVEKGAVPKASQEEDEEFAEAEEGRILTRVHRSRERSRKLVEQKKASVLKASGKLKWKFTTGGERRFAAKHLHGTQPAAETMPDPLDYYL